ncbi:hypothetical protein ACFL6P_07435 [Candidatus Latescibacterota bacterium]
MDKFDFLRYQNYFTGVKDHCLKGKNMFDTKRNGGIKQNIFENTYGINTGAFEDKKMIKYEKQWETDMICMMIIIKMLSQIDAD